MNEMRNEKTSLFGDSIHQRKHNKKICLKPSEKGKKRKTENKLRNKNSTNLFLIMPIIAL
jgi:hypothetical protein